MKGKIYFVSYVEGGSSDELKSWLGLSKSWLSHCILFNDHPLVWAQKEGRVLLSYQEMTAEEVTHVLDNIKHVGDDARSVRIK